jgi:copper chaperone
MKKRGGFRMRMIKETLRVEGMSCNHCANAVTGALKELAAEATVDLKAGTVTVAYDESRANMEQIKAAIEEQGYDVI